MARWNYSRDSVWPAIQQLCHWLNELSDMVVRCWSGVTFTWAAKARSGASQTSVEADRRVAACPVADLIGLAFQV